MCIRDLECGAERAQHDNAAPRGVVRAVRVGRMSARLAAPVAYLDVFHVGGQRSRPEFPSIAANEPPKLAVAEALSKID